MGSLEKGVCLFCGGLADKVTLDSNRCVLTTCRCGNAHMEMPGGRTTYRMGEAAWAETPQGAVLTGKGREEP